MVKAQSSTHNGASQTKRLCVRTPPSSSSDDSKLRPLVVDQQQHTNEQQQLLNSQAGVANMTASINVPAQEINQITKNQLDSTTLPSNPTPNANSSTSSNKQTNGCNSQQQADENHGQELINKLLCSDTSQQTQIEILISLRDLVTACNKKKDLILNNPSFNKIVNLLDDPKICSRVKAQIALLLCSLAKIKKENSKILSENNIAKKILRLVLEAPEDELLLACLRCLRSIFTWSLSLSAASILYSPQVRVTRSVTGKEQGISNDAVPKLVFYAIEHDSLIVKECIADIFSQTCQTTEQQNLLCNSNAVSCILKLLESPSHRVVIASLNWLAKLCYKNRDVSIIVSQVKGTSNETVLQKLLPMMDKSSYIEMQFIAAKCYAYFYRSCGQCDIDDEIITKRVLSTLVRMVHKDKPPHLRIKAAECISHFVEQGPELQMLASIYDHLIESLSDMLDYESESILIELRNCLYSTSKNAQSQTNGHTWSPLTQPGTLDLTSLSPLELSGNKSSVYVPDADLVDADGSDQKMVQAAFLGLASLCATKEDIRKKVTSSCSIMNHLVRCLSSQDTNTQKAALSCLLSLSRSVHLLRTTFAEVNLNLHGSIKNLMKTKSDEVMQLVLAVLCNVTLDFSSGKQHFTDKFTIETICEMTKRSDSMLRLHAIWVLMNTVYEAEQNLKFQILSTLGMEQVFMLLSEKDEEILLKTLGFLRNLLSQRQHIDAIMEIHGDQIMHAVGFILESDQPSVRVKEQALCILANIADGSDAKSFIMTREEILEKLVGFIGGLISELELAAIYCVSNLAWKGDKDFQERHQVLRKYGIVEKLKLRMNTEDQTLADRVKTAYNQFMDCV